jgi:hypothetical protein
MLHTVRRTMQGFMVAARQVAQVTVVQVTVTRNVVAMYIQSKGAHLQVHPKEHHTRTAVDLQSGNLVSEWRYGTRQYRSFHDGFEGCGGRSTS